MEAVSPRQCQEACERKTQGRFSDHCVMNYVVMDRALPLTMTALENVAFDKSTKRALCIADYATADGGTSVSLISHIIRKVKERFGDEQEIQVHYEDQPTADYNSLFRMLHGMDGAVTPSYLTQYKNVFTAACGTDFYSQCFPAESIHLGFCATAVHYLSTKPCNVMSSVFYKYSTDPKEIKAFEEAARKDWELFLINRARELVPGGHLVVSGLSSDREGQFPGNTSRVRQSLYRNLSKHWSNMVKDDIITQVEFENTTLNVYFRSEEEYTAPLMNTESTVYKLGLRLHTVESTIIPCPQHLSWINSSNKEDENGRKKHAQRFTAEVRCWSSGLFLTGLSADRTEQEKLLIVNELYRRYEEDVAEAPGDHAVDFVNVFMLIRKEIPYI